jgi:hypothetical protein
MVLQRIFRETFHTNIVTFIGALFHSITKVDEYILVAYSLTDLNFKFPFPTPMATIISADKMFGFEIHKTVNTIENRNCAYPDALRPHLYNLQVRSLSNRALPRKAIPILNSLPSIGKSIDSIVYGSNGITSRMLKDGEATMGLTFLSKKSIPLSSRAFDSHFSDLKSTRFETLATADSHLPGLSNKNVLTHGLVPANMALHQIQPDKSIMQVTQPPKNSNSRAISAGRSRADQLHKKARYAPTRVASITTPEADRLNV